MRILLAGGPTPKSSSTTIETHFLSRVRPYAALRVRPTVLDAIAEELRGLRRAASKAPKTGLTFVKPKAAML